ncbi:putative TIM-barrel fold metal-dependent hydrolase [Acidovorax sp. CF316]|uniref:amidohydrolase family protein n=1 Tax=Acidovorax sp. CF316 TaxID=1144317 RepID=UPI00026BC3EF|nr:amidohydrolase family protein [Acidovorax sp. CF316]EJE49634.1 putative TIM-barrel fold metal-dependent hydrolase [Acidovorax sp. CF316]
MDHPSPSPAGSPPRVPSRRGFLGMFGSLGTLGAIGATTFVPEGRPLAQTLAAKGSRIDFHHHFFSPAWVRLVERQHLQQPVLGFDQFKTWTVEKDLEAMDRGGVEKAFLSVTQPGVWFGNVAETRAAARELNEFAARMKADHPGRYGHFAVLPLPDVEGSLREIAHAFDVLKADGVGLLSSYDDKWLGDPSFAPVWAELNRRKAVVYVHATAPNCCAWNFQPGILPTFVELGSDLARAMVSLIHGGTAKATPDVHYIWSHGGGSIWAQRFLVGETAESLARVAPPDSRLHHLRRFYYDTAAAADAVHMGILKMIVPTSQIVFGSDFPWVEPARIVEGLEKSGLSASELQAIYRDNAKAVLR